MPSVDGRYQPPQFALKVRKMGVRRLPGGAVGVEPIGHEIGRSDARSPAPPRGRRSRLWREPGKACSVDLLGLKPPVLQRAEIDAPARVSEVEDDELGGGGSGVHKTVFLPRNIVRAKRARTAPHRKAARRRRKAMDGDHDGLSRNIGRAARRRPRATHGRRRQAAASRGRAFDAVARRRSAGPAVRMPRPQRQRRSCPVRGDGTRGGRRRRAGFRGSACGRPCGARLRGLATARPRVGRERCGRHAVSSA